MPIKPVILLTDACLFIIFITTVLIGISTWSNPLARAKRQQIFSKPLAMISFIILIFYVLIGLLDSLHFQKGFSINHHWQYSNHVSSVLDEIIQPKGYEKTYSAPFALHLYTADITFLHGKSMHAYSPLTYAGQHLSSPRAHDILIRSLQGAAYGLVAFIIIALAIYFLTTPKLAVHSLWITVFWICVLTGICLALAQEYHILGTNKIGEDVFYLTLKSVRTGLVIGIVTTLLTLPFALGLGMLSGYYGGFLDDIIQYLYTTLSSIPAVLLIAASILSLQIMLDKYANFFSTIMARADVRLFALCMILGITSWTSLCRLLRAETLKIREMDYILAARALGVTHGKIIFRHVLPNLMHIIIITIVLDFSGLVLAEAVLSYVGVGVDPTTISWGNMINSARLELAREPVVWWPLFAAFLFLFGLVLAANFFADVVREAYNPKLKEG